MSKFLLKISNPAKSDISDILTYTISNWGEEQFKKYSRRLNEAFAMILENPKIGKAREDLRLLPIEQHIIFYEINGNEISIVRILHKKMKFDTFL